MSGGDSLTIGSQTLTFCDMRVDLPGIDTTAIVNVRVEGANSPSTLSLSPGYRRAGDSDSG